MESDVPPSKSKGKQSYARQRGFHVSSAHDSRIDARPLQTIPDKPEEYVKIISKRRNLTASEMFSSAKIHTASLSTGDNDSKKSEKQVAMQRDYSSRLAARIKAAEAEAASRAASFEKKLNHLATFSTEINETRAQVLTVHVISQTSLILL